MKILTAFLLCASASFAVAETKIISSTPEALEVVIYRDYPVSTSSFYRNKSRLSGFALVSETRTVDLPSGDSTIQFDGTAETIVPQTARLDALPAHLLESNFDYDLLSPAEIITKSIGKQVRLVRTDDATGKVTEDNAILRSGPNGVLLEINGQIEPLGCSGLKEKIIFESVPSNLVQEPSLSVKVRLSQAGRYQLRLSYLTTGLDWSADYVARLLPDGKTSDLLGWITLTNRLSTSFPNAGVKVVAGDLEKDSTTSPEKRQRPSVATRCWPAGSFVTFVRPIRRREEFVQATPISMSALSQDVVVTARRAEAIASELGDYKLYSLPEPTTVAANQTKQVRLFDRKGVHYERVYTYDIDLDLDTTESQQVSAKATLRFENKQSNGLGVPIPMGAVAAFDVDASGKAIFAGDSQIRDIAVEAPAEIVTGESVNVWAEPHIVSKRDVEHWWKKYSETELTISVRNDKSVPIRFEVRYYQESSPDLKIISESESHTNRYGHLTWIYDLLPGQQEVLHLTLREPRQDAKSHGNDAR